MKVTELTKDQLDELKQAYACKRNGEEGISYGELIEAELIPDEVIFEHYAGITFTEDDFFATA